MKKLQVGLVIEGNLTTSTLLRLSSVTAELGPIKSSGLQVSRRVSNFLRGGYAVHTYADLSTARIILIRVPDSSVERLVADICQAEIDFTQHSFVLCETWTPTSMLKPLRMKGANIASLVLLPAGPEKTYVVEGDVAAVRQVRRLIERSNARTIELRTGTKHLLFAAAIACMAIPVPVLLMAQQALRDSGVSGNQLSTLIGGMSGEMLAGFLKGARTTWGGPLAESLDSSQSVFWEQLDDTHPEVAGSLKEWVAWSRAYLAKR